MEGLFLYYFTIIINKKYSFLCKKHINYDLLHFITFCICLKNDGVGIQLVSHCRSTLLLFLVFALIWAVHCRNALCPVQMWGNPGLVNHLFYLFEFTLRGAVNCYYIRGSGQLTVFFSLTVNVRWSYSPTQTGQKSKTTSVLRFYVSGT